MMTPLATSSIVFAAIFGFALLAMFLRRRLPEHHLSAESKDVVKLGMGTMATLAAVVLGLLIATAKGNYDEQNGAVQDLAAQVLLLDRVLAKYGPETKEARELLKSAVGSMLEHIWPEGAAAPGNLAPGEARAAGDAMYDRIADLDPKNDAARAALKTRALDLCVDLLRERLKMFARRDSSPPLPFLAVLVAWLAILYAGYGLVAPPNGTVVTVLLVCTLSTAGAIFLLLELSTPFAGLLRISGGPLRDALAALGK